MPLRRCASSMLSGDNRAIVERIAGQLGIDAVVAEVLPDDKAVEIVALQRGQEGRDGR